ncbi:MAG TPA: glycosyltransferase, partial [Flavobacterium sp.]|uniref:glycosyltransferase n=1 Tax=Flavobacterium sp. TaxID=239 RepID=UPI002DBF1352
MKIALVENFGSDFVGARLRYALFLKENGIEVTAIIPNDGHRKIIEEQGIRVMEVGANIRGNGIVNKINYAIKLRSILKNENFDLVHFYRLQPNIIGTFVAGISTKSKIVNHVTGLGVAFTNKKSKNLILQFVIKFLYRFNSYLFSPYTIYQNKQDALDLGVHKKSICIEGSAVNESKFDVEAVER